MKQTTMKQTITKQIQRALKQLLSGPKDFKCNLPEEIPVLAWRYHSIETDDGVRLTVQTIGPSPAEAPSVVLANGIGVTTPGLDFIANHLKDRFHVICWSYRGTQSLGLRKTAHPGFRRGSNSLETSSHPSCAKNVDYSIRRHARDALWVMDALGVEEASVLGWSMGVPVGLEMIRAAHDRVTAIGALFGAAGRPFEQAFPPRMARVVLEAAKLLSEYPQPAQGVLELASTLPGACWEVCTRLGFVGPTAHKKNFAANVAAVAEGDRSAYFKTMVSLMEHDAADMLSSITCPVLVVGGEKDWVTPPKAARMMAEKIPHAKLVMLEMATHFGVIEYGKELWDAIDELLSQIKEKEKEEKSKDMRKVKIKSKSKEKDKSKDKSKDRIKSKDKSKSKSKDKSKSKSKEKAE